MIDHGSDNTIITKNCAERLNLKPLTTKNSFNIQTVTGERKQHSTKTKLPITEEIELDLYVIESNLCLDKEHIDLDKIWPTLDEEIKKEVKENMADGAVDIVIGVDQLYRKIDKGNTIRHPIKGLSLIKTCLGWSIGGSVLNKVEPLQTIPEANITPSVSLLSTGNVSSQTNDTEPTLIEEDEHSSEREILEDMRKLFETELAEDEKDQNKTEDERYAEQSFKANVTYKDGKYWVKPIFKPNFKPMKSNYTIALRKYKALRNRLNKNVELEKMYCEAMNTLIANNEVERVHESQEQLSDPTRHLYYIPHMAVVRMDKVTTKCRPVFNASSKNYEGISLNDNLLPGPKSQLSIPHLMMHLRMNPVVLISDVSRMYYSIQYLEKIDFDQTKMKNLRDLYRFLWRRNPNEPPDAYRFNVILVGSTDGPYLSAATIHHHLDNIIQTSMDEEVIAAARLIKARLYIDDLILSFRDIATAIKIRSIISNILKDMGKSRGKDTLKRSSSKLYWTKWSIFVMRIKE